ncbi:O-antigen ligase family protein [Phenylobacterium sp.]|uniref:O-antigen ligase family protein n=1 Tax=Phenylobacterium sp. TaxID=1871053 RepID=UPI0035ADED50
MTYSALGGQAAPAPRRATAWDVAGLASAAGLFLIYSQFWVFPLFGEQMSASEGGLLRLLFLPAYGAAVMVAALSPRETLAAAARQPFLLVLMAIVAASTFWSISPDQTARRIIAIGFTTLGGVAVAARWRWARLTEILAACFALLAVLSLATCVAVPSIGVMHELFPGAWRGLWPEKNAFGGIMTLGFVVLAAAGALNPVRARLWWAFAALSVFLVLMSTSKTSLVSLIVGMAALVFVALARRGPATRVVVIWMAVVGLVAVGGIALFAADAVFELLGKDATLTGRTKIWAAVWRQIQLRPWTGYGYGAVWDEAGPWGPLAWIIKQAGFRPQHAHNSWLEQWLGMGVFGLGAFALFYLQTLALAVVALFRGPGAFLAIPFLAVYSLETLTESVAVTYHDFRWVLFVIVAVKLAWPDDEIPERAL